MQTADEFWAEFAQDPRESGAERLRASDADRNRVHRLLSEAVGDGRLTVVEFDERSASVFAARTLDELPPLVDDLLPARTAALARREDATPVAVQDRAVAAYRRDVREAVAGFLIPSIICMVIWLIVMPGGFFWPGFVILGTGINLLQTVLRREDIVAKHRDKLEKKQAKKQAKQLERKPAEQPVE
jgi:hypothetical protein